MTHSSGALGQRHRAEGDLHRVAEDVGAGAPLRDAEAALPGPAPSSRLEHGERRRRAERDLGRGRVQQAYGAEALGRLEEPVALVAHGPAERLGGRLAWLRTVVAVAAVREHAHELDPRKGGDGEAERDGLVRRDAAAVPSGVDLQQHPDGLGAPRERLRREARPRLGVDRERDADARVEERRDAGQLLRAGDGRREAQVGEPGRGERLGLVQRGDGQPVRARRDLHPGDLGRLCASWRAAGARRPPRRPPACNPVERSREPRQVHEQGGRGKVGDEHGAEVG